MASERFTELARIAVQVGPPGDEGALAPMTDGDSLVLRSKVPVGTAASIGINVDSLVIMDALENGTIFEVEVVVPRSAWATTASNPKPPSSIDKGSLVFADPGPRIWVDQLSPRVSVDRGGRLLVSLEPVDAETRWVALSGRCSALLNGEFLAGFVASTGA